eukprot:160165-Chlamydomonas_euryale.AAC.4
MPTLWVLGFAARPPAPPAQDARLDFVSREVRDMERTDAEWRALITMDGLGANPEDHQARVENPLVPADFVQTMGVYWVEETEDYLASLGHLATPDEEVGRGAQAPLVVARACWMAQAPVGVARACWVAHAPVGVARACWVSHARVGVASACWVSHARVGRMMGRRHASACFQTCACKHVLANMRMPKEGTAACTAG